MNYTNLRVTNNENIASIAHFYQHICDPGTNYFTFHVICMEKGRNNEFLIQRVSHSERIKLVMRGPLYSLRVLKYGILRDFILILFFFLIQ